MQPILSVNFEIAKGPYGWAVEIWSFAISFIKDFLNSSGINTSRSLSMVRKVYSLPSLLSNRSDFV